ncbi:molybdopterin-dependent oxidoreductase [Adhaeribacter radiodurans]|uniref:Molybdopterin-dependent oxidoreductase n=1 Tax=Adhaeribacter radiodurans TaxID=2745197 RepID=A0A7L7LBH4_9BACT|nr:molybdopterin-dependent oxidoreductase [Adhaeribacter radiodurans]QMU29749.1 molybdopterin-dependent oxidoreductase [Adhaeribacter radiodurans]
MAENNPFPTEKEVTEQKIKRRTFLAFTVFTVAGLGSIGIWKAFRTLPKSKNGLAAPSRQVLAFNEKVNTILFSDQHLAPTYPIEAAARKPRVNGRVGLSKNFDSVNWQLQVNEPGKSQSLSIPLDDIKRLPKTELIFDFKCIEGWNQIVHYGGVKFSDFLQAYQLGTQSGKPLLAAQPKDWYPYVGLETPDRGYYVGLDMPSVLHPQTLLCYEMNREDLSLKHGAPLRLIIPTKYGVKSLKRIGTLFFSLTQPRDYWHERGYIYDSSL